MWINVLQLSNKVRCWDASLALWILVKVKTRFMKYLHFLKIFYLARRQKINWLWWIWFFFYFPTAIFQFNLNTQSKIEWQPGHLDRVYIKSVQVIYFPGFFLPFYPFVEIGKITFSLEWILLLVRPCRRVIKFLLYVVVEPVTDFRNYKACHLL